MERFFCTAGPVQSDINYFIDSLGRVEVAEMENFIAQRKYFILHAPRQTGKTSALLALRDHLNESGLYVAIYANIEGGQALRNDVRGVVGAVLDVIASEAASVVGDDTPRRLKKQVTESSVSEASWLTQYLEALSVALPRPVVLFLDEIDSLVGDSLVSVLRQIRAGYANRPSRFPQTVVLCGVRDVRDYRIETKGSEIVTGGSAFNIKASSIRLGDFTMDDICNLYGQHTKATGQIFDDDCFPVVWNATEGQPWLVNALANEVTFNMRENRDRTVRITAEMIYRAQERIIYRRDTHLDCLIDKLREERVRRVIAPMLSCADEADVTLVPQDDVQYVVDLGLIKDDKPRRIANAIYREVIPRELTWTTQSGLKEQPEWFMRPDNSIDMEKLLTDFQQFFRSNADSWIGKFDYKESGPQLLLQAYLQRIVNGGGYIDREYGLGRRRTDILITKPLTSGYGGPVQRVVLELKILRGSLEECISKGLEQTAAYMDLCGGDINEGHFIIFDRSSTKSWDERIWHENRLFAGRKIGVWGM